MQVLGTQDEQQDPNEDHDDDMPEEDDGLEMTNEFEGELHDVEKKDDNDSDASDDDDFDENELDEMMGEVGDEDADNTEKDQKIGDDSDTEDNKPPESEGANDGGTKYVPTSLEKLSVWLPMRDRSTTVHQ